MKRLFLSITLATTAACGGAEQKAPAPPPPKPVELLTLAPAPLRDSAEYLGSLLSRDSVSVLPQVAGYVRRIHVRPGQQVKAGAVLVEIDSRSEEAQKSAAVAQVKAQETRLSLAQQTFTRAEALVKEGLAPAQDLERAQAEVDAALAAKEAAIAAVTAREVLLQYHAVRAAVSGTIGEVHVRTGDAVNAGTLITTIANTGTLELSVGVPASKARALPSDAVIEILDDAGAVLVSSTVFYMAPQADVRTQLVVVKSVFDNDKGLRPQEVVRARVVFGESTALQVPVLSVVRQSGQAFLYKVTPTQAGLTAARVPVTTGAINGQAVVIESGVGVGDRIAVSSIQGLRDGIVVIDKSLKQNAAKSPADG